MSDCTTFSSILQFIIFKNEIIVIYCKSFNLNEPRYLMLNYFFYLDNTYFNRVIRNPDWVPFPAV